MKVAIIVNPLIPVPPAQYGGIERIVYMLIQELVKHGHNITLYAHPDSQPGCKLVAYFEHSPSTLLDALKINMLTARIALEGFDLVHTFGRMSNIAVLMPLSIPKIVSYQLPPTVSQVKKAVKLARKNSLHFTACSNFIAASINAFAPVTTIYNGVDMADYQFNKTVDADAPLVFLGRIQKEKGTSVAIKLAQATSSKLIIAGNVPAEPIHQAYFKKEVEPFIDQDKICYIGPVNNLQKNELLRNARAFLMPVLWDEPFGIVMAEALACGTPVIGFNRGAVPEVVKNGANGFVCNDEHEMIKAIQSIPLIDRANCRRIAEEKFSASVLAAQYLTVYQNITGNC